VLKHPKIEVLWDTVVDDVLGDNNVQGVLLRNVKTGEMRELPVTGYFAAIGHEPNTKLFRGLVDMDEVGYIRPQVHTMTSVPGVFAAGDVVDHRYRQAITAAADGCRAAIDAERWLESRGEVDPSKVLDPALWGDLHPEDGGPSRSS
jgi:thioredoxin reductase (NADPH)